MSISDRELEHIRRKQREFLDALLVRKWTTPRRSLGEQDALEVGQKVGLMPILVCEFLHYWVASGDLDESWRPIAVKIQKSLGDSAFEQIEAGFPEDGTTSNATGGTERTTPLVFLCHASEDKAAVRDYAARLTEAGFATWLDEEELLPGQDWDVEIRKAIERSSAVIVFLSARSQKRGYIQKEIVRVLDESERQPEGTIFLIPAKLEPCEVPSRLSRWQWVDLASSSGFKKLCKALDTHRVKRT
ncbi:MAG: toll/interleukin-1 receptor domain-containing protein [Burkholderiales bacterium]